MDHIYNSIEAFWKVYMDSFIDEQKRGNYKKLTDNPCYIDLKAINDAMNILRKRMGDKTVSLQEELKEAIVL